MRSGEFCVLKAWVVVCVFFATLQHFATFFEFVAVIAATGRLNFVRQGRVYIQCCGEGAGGGQTTWILAVQVWLFWQQRAVSPLWLGFASADVGWVIWIEVVITRACGLC